MDICDFPVAVLSVFSVSGVLKVPSTQANNAITGGIKLTVREACLKSIRMTE